LELTQEAKKKDTGEKPMKKIDWGYLRPEQKC
jgi:hypothetical protein